MATTKNPFQKLSEELIVYLIKVLNFQNLLELIQKSLSVLRGKESSHRKNFVTDAKELEDGSTRFTTLTLKENEEKIVQKIHKAIRAVDLIIKMNDLYDIVRALDEFFGDSGRKDVPEFTLNQELSYKLGELIQNLEERASSFRSFFYALNQEFFYALNQEYFEENERKIIEETISRTTLAENILNEVRKTADVFAQYGE